VYGFDYSVSKFDSIEWFLNGSYINSTVQFPAPRILPWQLYRLKMLFENVKTQYFMLIGNFIIKYMNKTPVWIRGSAPVSYFIDFKGEDMF